MMLMTTDNRQIFIWEAHLRWAKTDINEELADWFLELIGSRWYHISYWDETSFPDVPVSVIVAVDCLILPARFRQSHFHK